MNVNNKMKKLLSFALLGADVLPTLAQAIDRMMDEQSEKRRAKRAARMEEEMCEVCVEDLEEICEAPCDEAEAVVCDAEEIPTMAQAENVEENFDGEAEDDADDVAEDSDDDKDDEEGDASEKGRFGSTSGLVFFDAHANPEKYAELLAREKRGEVRILTRYRHSFASRLWQAEDEVQEYYSILKNKLLSYKGVKSRQSWASESFNKGRNYVAKVNVKSKTIYLYLAMDPLEVAAMEDGKYRIKDLSEKKKYAAVPVLFKIKGPRKLKYALELIEILCSGRMELPLNKKFVETDYKSKATGLDAFVESGEVKMMVCGVENDEI